MKLVSAGDHVSSQRRPPAGEEDPTGAQIIHLSIILTSCQEQSTPATDPDASVGFVPCGLVTEAKLCRLGGPELLLFLHPVFHSLAHLFLRLPREDSSRSCHVIPMNY